MHINKVYLLHKYPILHKIYDLFTSLTKCINIGGVPFSNGKNDLSPFFIVGSGRSGNTLLRRILDSNKNVFIPPETYVLGKLFRLHNLHKNREWDEYVNIMLAELEYHPEFYTFEIDSLAKLAKNLKKAEKEDQSLSHIVNSIFMFIAEEKGIKNIIWGDKTPTNSLYVYRIKKLFPKAKFVHIIRDGVDVVNSYVNSGIYDNYKDAALRWKGSVNALKRFGDKYPSTYFEVYYESLVRNPEVEVCKLCDFIGIPFKEETISINAHAKVMGDVTKKDHHKNVFKPINTQSIGKGRKTIDCPTKEQISKILNPTLEKIGYKKV